MYRTPYVHESTVKNQKSKTSAQKLSDNIQQAVTDCHSLHLPSRRLVFSMRLSNRECYSKIRGILQNPQKFKVYNTIEKRWEK